MSFIWVKKYVILIFLIFIFTNLSYAQSIGKIYDKDEADKIYGPSNKTLSLTRTALDDILDKTNKYVLFRIENNQVVILGDDRKVLSPVQYNLSEDEVFHLYSKSKVVELLNKGKSSTVYVEQRQTPLTLTNGNYTLEDSELCPPFCN